MDAARAELLHGEFAPGDLQALNEVYLLGSATHKSTASIGIALLTKRTVGIEELMKQIPFKYHIIDGGRYI